MEPGDDDNDDDNDNDSHYIQGEQVLEQLAVYNSEVPVSVQSVENPFPSSRCL